MAARDAFESNYAFSQEAGCWTRKNSRVEWGYSDGEEVERALFEAVTACVDRSTLSPELAGRIVDWPSRYYFSARRANLLRPFASLLGGRVLEVGAGCGALSRYLGETATEVVALEPSARRARVAAARCEGLPTVKVVVDDLESFARIGQRFDAVTLVGVLEYAHRFSDRSDAAVHWLRVARDLLRPGGVLLLAIENKLGLKYFAGAPEDHLGRPMLGIGDLYEDRGPRTWGRAELEAMLREAGYAATGFALPLPDYKLPTSVLLSSDGDAMPGFDGGVALAEAAVGRDADLGGVPLFPMDRTWAVLAGNGLLVELANSFLVVAHADATELVYGAANASCSGYHYSVDRRPRFSKEATFLRGAGAGVVVRRLLAGEAADASERKYACRPVSEDYVRGDSWSRLLYRNLRREGWKAEDFAGWLRDWLAAVCDQAGVPRAELARTGYSPNLLLPGDCIDLLPQNLMREPQGSVRFIDREWVRDGGVPLGYLVFRGLFETLSACPPVACPHDEAELSFKTFIHRLTGALDPALVPDESTLSGYLREEHEFQLAASGADAELEPEALAAARLPVAPFAAVEGSAGRVVDEALSLRDQFHWLRDAHHRLEEENARVYEWARSLDAEQQALSDRLGGLQSEYDERTRWAQSLDAERQALSDRLGGLQSEYDERTRWAQSLDAERQALSDRLGGLQSEYEERTQWALSLQTELGQERERMRAYEEAARSEIDGLRSTVASVESERRRTDAALRQLREEYERLVGSRSWKLTRPLRVVARMLRGDKG